MIDFLRKQVSGLLRKVADDMDAGKVELSDADFAELCQLVEYYCNPEAAISKHQACRLLHVSRQTFDNWVKDGKLPKGRHKIGFKELFWNKREILDIAKTL